MSNPYDGEGVYEIVALLQGTDVSNHDLETEAAKIIVMQAELLQLVIKAMPSYEKDTEHPDRSLIVLQPYETHAKARKAVDEAKDYGLV